MKSYPRIYKALRKHGHSGAKATEIIIDARRGKWFALEWIRCIYKMRHPGYVQNIQV